MSTMFVVYFLCQLFLFIVVALFVEVNLNRYVREKRKKKPSARTTVPPDPISTWSPPPPPLTSRPASPCAAGRRRPPPRAAAVAYLAGAPTPTSGAPTPATFPCRLPAAFRRQRRSTPRPLVDPPGLLHAASTSTMVSPTTPASPLATPSPTNMPPSKWTPFSGKIPSQSRTASTAQPHPRTLPPHPSWRHLPPSHVEQATSPSVMKETITWI
ncbi:proline-rich receptor-like protein kinase PERK2 [Triticum urartu]|uniref:proline-rich receptor-like protein kinase PERK2 n=1 Tax=Triticum urartu TaxID=4572 RepID=UPI002044970B|nr:proline-rich receptor-like protein kinase PERK2 [Triticum urartu]